MLEVVLYEYLLFVVQKIWLQYSKHTLFSLPLFFEYKHQLHIVNTFGSITYEFFNNKKNYHFDLTGAFSNIIEESEAIEYDDDDDEEEFDDDDDD